MWIHRSRHGKCYHNFLCPELSNSDNILPWAAEPLIYQMSKHNWYFSVHLRDAKVPWRQGTIILNIVHYHKIWHFSVCFNKILFLITFESNTRTILFKVNIVTHNQSCLSLTLLKCFLEIQEPMSIKTHSSRPSIRIFICHLSMLLFIDQKISKSWMNWLNWWLSIRFIFSLGKYFLINERCVTEK